MNVLDWLLQQDRVELAAAVVTLVSVLLAARNSVHTWWTGILGCVLYGEVFLRAKLYPDVTLQGFFVVTSVLGWWAWLRGERGAPLPVRRSSARFLLGVAALGAGCGVGYGALWSLTDAAAPYADALLAAFSVVGQLALTARRVEAWWAWLLVNSIAVPLYASRGLWLTTWLYAAFWVNALLALPRWYALGPARRHGMSARFATGLVVGKFAPLHAGHELLIARARAACGRVIVFSYVKPEFALCEPARRKAWLDARSPDTTNLVFGADGFVAGVAPADLADASSLARAMPAEVEPADAQRRYVAAVCQRLVGRVDAVFTSEDYGDPFAAVLAAAQGAPVAHVQVDRARATVPISATAIRGDPHAARAFLAPEVYAGFVARVCILGAESTGKTTLAQALAERLGTCWAPEYGRELWVHKRGALVYEDLLHIAQAQVAREEALARQAVRWLFCDTSPRTTVFYSEALFGRVDPRLQALRARHYAHTVLCARDIPFTQDGTRQDAAFAARQQAWHEATLAEDGIEPLRVAGDVLSRVAQVEARLLR